MVQQLILRWIKESWAAVSQEVIVKSFKKTGISLALDGTEDDVFGEESPFEGFTEAEVAATRQFNENVQLDSTEYSEPEPESEENDDYDCPQSPGK